MLNSFCVRGLSVFRFRHLKSSLEAEVDIILPSNISMQPYLLRLIEREGGQFDLPVFRFWTVFARRDFPEDAFHRF